MKENYRKFCQQTDGIPIFSAGWWLDAVCGQESWDVALLERNGEVIAGWTYYIEKRYGLQWMVMPPLTQSMGLWILYPANQRYAKRLAYEKEIVDELLVKLPPVAYFRQNFHYSVTNWLPLCWRGFQQTTRYSYVIERLTDLDEVFAGFAHAKRKNIKKAEGLVSVKQDLSAREFYDHHVMTLAKQDARISYSWELFQRLYRAGYERGAAKTFYAVDRENQIHAALFIVWDRRSAYDLISTIDPDYRHSGAASLLIREAIKYVSDKTERFDFEGSMTESVENSFRQFGAVQKPFFSVSKLNRTLRVCQAVRALFTAVVKG